MALLHINRDCKSLLDYEVCMFKQCLRMLGYILITVKLKRIIFAAKTKFI